MEQTQPFERYGLIDWLFTCYVEMGDMEHAKAVLDEIDDDLPAPQMHYGYKRRVRLYKGLIAPEAFIDEDDIRKHMVDQDNRMQLEITTLLFGLYIYYMYHGEEQKANQTLLEILKDPYKGRLWRNQGGGCCPRKRIDLKRRRARAVHSCQGALHHAERRIAS